MFLCGLALTLVVAGCGPSDPLDKVRHQQDVSGDFKGSIEPLRKLLDERPDDPEVQFRYGTALIAAGDPGFAIWPLKKAIESPEWLARAGMPLAGVLISSGAHDEAIEILGRIIEQNPDQIDALLLRAHARVLSRRHYEDALADADHVLAVDPENVDALGPRAVALLALERVDEAAVVIDELDQQYRDDSLGLHGSPELCMARATFAMEKGERDDAEQRFNACVELFPTEPIVLNGAIDFFDGLHMNQRADDILKHAIELVPESYSFRSSMVVRLDAAGRTDEAKALLREGTKLPSVADAADAWAGLASYCLDKGDLDEALDAFARASALDGSGSPQLQLAYADALVMAKRYDDALALVDKMSTPAHQAVLRARIALERGDPQSALKLFDEGLRVWPNNAVARYYSAVAAERIGDFNRAVEDYRYSMRIDVNATDAYLRLARLEAARGQYEAAQSTLGFQAGDRPEERAAALLQVRLLGRLGRERSMSKYLREQLARDKAWGAAIAEMAEGVRERSGPKAAIALIQSAKPLELDDPKYSEALAALVENLAEAGNTKEAVALTERAVRKHPESADFHALHGRALHRSKAPAASAREEFDRALALDDKNAHAVLGLARLEADAGSKEASVPLYERAVAADPTNSAAAREFAEVLVALQRSADAEQKLEDLLREVPYDAPAARTLAGLRVARGNSDERTVELARRAVAFGGGPEATAFLQKIAPRGGADAS
jgi:tetratricopeptide (TPR) repeat protein